MNKKVSNVRLAILSSHPIQYNAPLFRELANQDGLTLRVFYCWEGTANSFDHEFNRPVTLDIPLLEGYDWEMVPNVAKDPGTHHFGGLHNPEMNSRIARFDPDCLLVFGWAWRTNLSALRHFHGRIPVLFRGDSTLRSTHHARWKSWLRRTLLTWVYRHVDLALSPGQENRKYLKAMGFPEDRIRHMPHAIDIHRFSADDPESSRRAHEMRSNLGISPEALVFLFAGKFVQRKQVHVLLAAFRELRTELPSSDMHLVLVGDGPDEPMLRRQSEETPSVHFCGFRNQSEMPATYRMADVYVLPSVRDTWGLGLNEALAAGCVAIASDHVGAAPDLLEARQYGRIFECGNSAALCAAMREFVDLRSDLPMLARQAVEDSPGWSIESAAEAVAAVIREATESPLR
ncbi:MULTISPECIES: glycosyltransferase family 4 protein [unclassified Minwuia]|uniref:glycosyltransferase family 4 protein n=1 Tax=unclassified Minwuia TaxID=2618799 RepID=UPI002479753E|nr:MULTISPECIES: glycosyltransferase family 4 protein [unclassified Minwuia]